jgi:hypothetical protein
VTALCLQHWLTRATADSPGIEETMLAAIALAAGVLVMALEGPLNGSAWLWCALSGALALTVLRACLRAARQH